MTTPTPAPQPSEDSSSKNSRDEDSLPLRTPIDSSARREGVCLVDCWFTQMMAPIVFPHWHEYERAYGQNSDMVTLL